MDHFKILIIILFLLGCASPKNVQGKSDLETAQSRWENAAISSYEFTQSISCYCTEEYRRAKVIVVRNGVIESVDQTPIDEAEFQYKTIPDFFDYITTTLESDPAVFDIVYNNTYGYPTQIYFDLNENMADEEIAYTLTNFKILN